MASEKKYLPEDVLAVILGCILIAGVLTTAFLLPGYKFITPVYQWANSHELFTKVFAWQNLLVLAVIGIIFTGVTAIAVRFSGKLPNKFLFGFPVLYVLAIVSFILSGNKSINSYGIEYVIFALLFGLFLNNFFSLPEWLKQAARAEFFIKTGLVILGSSVLFTDIIKAGFTGLIQAILVVTAVWFFAMWLSRKLKVDDEFAVIIASAVSICGVSAAIVAAGAIQGDKKNYLMLPRWYWLLLFQCFFFNHGSSGILEFRKL